MQVTVTASVLASLAQDELCSTPAEPGRLPASKWGSPCLYEYFRYYNQNNYCLKPRTTHPGQPAAPEEQRNPGCGCFP